jgi:glycosyltransferase involved in cell wall biosynthesis
MTALRVVVDEIVNGTSAGIRRYAEELTRSLIETAPSGSEVSGIISASPEAQYDGVARLLPGLSDLHKSPLARSQLASSWRRGLGGMPRHGLVHAPSLFAPLVRHDRLNDLDQVVVTIHDSLAWTTPQLISSKAARWQRAMGRRAERHADAIVVPTYSVGEELSNFLAFGDRIRVVGGAVSQRLMLPVDPDQRADDLGLPERYVAFTGSWGERKGLEQLIRSLSAPADPGLPLVIMGHPGWNPIDINAVAADAGVASGRIRILREIDDQDLAVAISRAQALVVPSVAEGFGLPVLEAFSLGTPVIHSNVAAIREVAAGAGLEVELNGVDDPIRLAEASRQLADSPQLAERLRYGGLDRAKAFSWRDSAERIWELHADL